VCRGAATYYRAKGRHPLGQQHTWHANVLAGERVRSLLRRAWNDDDYSDLASTMAPDRHNPSVDSAVGLRDVVRMINLINAYKAVAPDLHFDVRASSQRETHCISWQADGHHTGWLLGRAPSQRRLRLSGEVRWCRSRAATSPVECDWDRSEFLRQTGVGAERLTAAVSRPDDELWVRSSFVAAGTPLLFFPTPALPGWLSWKRVMDLLKNKRPLITFQSFANVAGFWRRPVPSEYCARFETTKCEFSLRRSGLAGPLDVVAHSMGAVTALDFAVHNPGRVRRVVLVEPTIGGLLLGCRFRPEVAQSFSDRESWYQGKMSKHRYARFLRAIHRDDYDPVRSPFWPMLAAHRWNMAYRLRLLAEGEAGWISTVRAPILVVRGRQTTPIQRLIVSQLAACAQNCRVVDMPGGHAPHAGASGAQALVDLADLSDNH